MPEQNNDELESIIRAGRRLPGGDIHVTMPNGHQYRGPIRGIDVNGDTLTITCWWMAASIRNRAWRAVQEPSEFSFELPLVEDPFLFSNGETSFTYENMRVRLYPRGGNKLQPSLVLGLTE